MTPPVGLQQLISSEQLTVKRKTTVLQGNKYVVFDSMNKPILFIKEQTGLLFIISGKDRAFNMRITNENKTEIISLRRPFTFGPDKMEVSLCGNVVSVIREKPTIMTPVLYINDVVDNTVLRIKGPITKSGECNFDLQTPDKQSIGVIQKRWKGFMQEMFTDSHEFDIQFPAELDVRFKAAVLGACILIDFLYYQR